MGLSKTRGAEKPGIVSRGHRPLPQVVERSLIDIVDGIGVARNWVMEGIDRLHAPGTMHIGPVPIGRKREHIVVEWTISFGVCPRKTVERGRDIALPRILRCGLSTALIDWRVPSEVCDLVVSGDPVGHVRSVPERLSKEIGGVSVHHAAAGQVLYYRLDHPACYNLIGLRYAEILEERGRWLRTSYQYGIEQDGFP